MAGSRPTSNLYSRAGTGNANFPEPRLTLQQLPQCLLGVTGDRVVQVGGGNGGVKLWLPATAASMQSYLAGLFCVMKGLLQLAPDD